MPPLLDSTLVVGTEDGQAGRCCWPGQSPWTGVVWSRILLLIEVCLMVMIVPGLCLLNVSISSLVWSEWWLGFEDSGITVASLWNEFVRLSVRRLCYPPLDFHEKSWPNKHLAPKFAHLFTLCWSLYYICGFWVAVHLYIPDPRDSMERGQTKMVRVCRGGMHGQVTQDDYSLALCSFPALPVPASFTWLF